MTNKKSKNVKIKKLNQVYQFLIKNEYSEFYKNKYRDSGIRLKKITTLKDFESLPFLTRDEIVNCDPLDLFFLPKNKIGFIGFSSGTTNQKYPLVIFGSQNNKWIKKFYHNKLEELKIERILQIYPILPAQQRLLFDGDARYKGIITISGDLTNLPLTATIAKKMNIDCISTTASTLYFFIPYLKKEINPDNIKMIILGGEYCSELKYKYFRKIFKNAYFRFNFGSAETGAKGFRCDYLNEMAPRFFHPAKTRFYFEQLNPSEESELILTTLNTKAWPWMIRYKTGDSVSITDFKCKCGEDELMEVFGKLEYDVLKISGTFIYSSKLNEAIIPYSKYLASLDFRLHVYEKIKGDKILPELILQVVPKRKIALNEAKNILEKGISENLMLASNSTLSDLVKKGIFMPFKVEFVEEFPFAQKQKNIISHLI